MKENVALIGFMGTGKTSVAERLAARMGKRCLDLDAVIAEKSGKTIPRIFEEDGEKVFRNLETEAVKEASRKSGVVLACGGGVVLDKVNIEHLRRNSVIICLTAKPEKILERVGASGTRPLLNVQDRSERMRRLLSSRDQLYEGSADHMVDTTDLTIDQVVERIVAVLGREMGEDQ